MFRNPGESLKFLRSLETVRRRWETLIVAGQVAEWIRRPQLVDDIATVAEIQAAKPSPTADIISKFVPLAASAANIEAIQANFLAADPQSTESSLAEIVNLFPVESESTPPTRRANGSIEIDLRDQAKAIINSYRAA